MHALDREARQLREAIVALAPTKRARRFGSGLELRVVTHAQCRLAEGTSLTAIGKALDISEPTLTRFLRRARLTALVPVVVKPPPRPPLVLHGPCGVSVSGDVEELAVLIARLSCSG